MTNLLITLDKSTSDNTQFQILVNNKDAGIMHQETLMLHLYWLGLAPDHAFRLVKCAKDLGIGYCTINKNGEY